VRSGCKRFFKDQTGSISVIAVVSMVAMLGIGALAVDIAHLTLVKSELQKAAEAGALADARGLDQNRAPNQMWNWTYAKTVAIEATLSNSVEYQGITDERSLSNMDPDKIPNIVELGYWDISWTNGIPNTPPANGHLLGYTNPEAYTPASTNEIAAVRIMLAKAQGGSGVLSPVSSIFASVLGSSSMNAFASSIVAIRPSPTTIAAGDAFPFAIPYSYVKENWYKNPPVSFYVGSAQHVSDGGQWTSFKETNNSASYISGLIINGNPVSISVGDQIYIQTGEKSSIYNTVLSQFNSNPNKIYMVAVIPDSFTLGAYTTVKAWSAFKITGCSGSGNDPWVSGQFVPDYMNPKASGAGGEHLGSALPPKLVN
jgi:Flp pilus assembly protein TadG